MELEFILQTILSGPPVKNAGVGLDIVNYLCKYAWVIARVDIWRLILFDLLFIGFTSGKSKRELERWYPEWREDIHISGFDFVNYLLRPCCFTILYTVVTGYASSETKCPILDHLVTIRKTV